jgi:hypothetical protein
MTLRLVCTILVCALGACSPRDRSGHVQANLLVEDAPGSEEDAPPSPDAVPVDAPELDAWDLDAWEVDAPDGDTCTEPDDAMATGTCEGGGECPATCEDCGTPPDPDPSEAWSGTTASAASCDLPQGCTAVRGNAKWLQCFRDNQGGFCNCLGSCLSSGSCDLSSTQQDQIYNNCQGNGRGDTWLICLADGIRAGLAGMGKACRHHAACMDVLVKRGGGSSGGTNQGWRNGGSCSLGRHAWNEYSVDGGNATIIVDSFNNIVVRCLH